MAVVILIALGAALLWAAGLYLFPFRHCRKCGGTGRKVRKLNRGHFALCNRCAGTGRVQRLGSRLIHRATLTARTEYARSRADRRDRKAADRAALPEPPRVGARRRY
jgi:hypothetical protein